MGNRSLAKEMHRIPSDTHTHTFSFETPEHCDRHSTQHHMKRHTEEKKKPEKKFEIAIQ